jgi:glucokinase
MNHKIYTGSAYSGGTDLGHTVICAGGRQCSCGRRGCLEAYASATALTKMTKEKMEELSLKGIPSKLFEVAEKEGKVSARTAFDAMRLGDDYAKKIVDDYIFYLAEGVTNMINIFQPDILTIGGGVCNEKDYLMVPLLRHVEREQYTRDNKNKTKVMIAALKNDAGIIGAAGLEG